MAKSKGKNRGKAAKKPRKAMKMAAKTAVRKSAKAHKKRMAKPGKKAGKMAAKHAKKHASNRAIMIPIESGKAKADPANPLCITIPAMPFGYSRDSVMNALVVMLMLFALIGAGVFYPQTKAPQQALTAPVMMQKK